MIHALQSFTPSPRHVQVHFSIERSSRGLDFSFSLLGARPIHFQEVLLRGLKPAETRQRRDEIWKSTCFEIFVGSKDPGPYLELNLCPSGDWNLYVFDHYREGMRWVDRAQAPLRGHEISSQLDRATWQAHLPSEGSVEVAQILASPSLVLGATAVIEYQDGTREYWALTHAGEKPDFHIRESFRLVL
jgi:hypothetical protein